MYILVSLPRVHKKKVRLWYFTLGWPSLMTLCTRISALNACTSSESRGCTFKMFQMMADVLWSHVYTIHSIKALEWDIFTHKPGKELTSNMLLLGGSFFDTACFLDTLGELGFCFFSRQVGHFSCFSREEEEKRKKRGKREFRKKGSISFLVHHQHHFELSVAHYSLVIEYPKIFNERVSGGWMKCHAFLTLQNMGNQSWAISSWSIWMPTRCKCISPYTLLSNISSNRDSWIGMRRYQWSYYMLCLFPTSLQHKGIPSLRHVQKVSDRRAIHAQQQAFGKVRQCCVHSCQGEIAWHLKT